MTLDTKLLPLLVDTSKMGTRILICDDSSFARKQIQRALPEDWEVEVEYASDGQEALQILRNQPCSVLFLDLNMPVMDGYAVLAALRQSSIAIRVVVVSGDIQPEAYQRVIELGALEFIRKPVDVAEIARVIHEHDLKSIPVDNVSSLPSAEQFDAYREITNVAMGQAADLLARVLNRFVIMPIPNVSMIEYSELEMVLHQVSERDNVSAICQGFVGGGLAGEALLLFTEASYEDIAELTQYEDELDKTAEIELLMDLTNILIGACLKGIAEQFDIKLSLAHPKVLKYYDNGRELVHENNKWKSTLAIDMHIAIEGKNIQGNLLLLFTEDSVSRFDQLISYLAA